MIVFMVNDNKIDNKKIQTMIKRSSACIVHSIMPAERASRGYMSEPPGGPISRHNTVDNMRPNSILFLSSQEYLKCIF